MIVRARPTRPTIHQRITSITCQASAYVIGVTLFAVADIAGRAQSAAQRE